MWKSYCIKLVCLLCFLLSVASFSYAYTFDDFVDFCTKIRDGEIPCNSLQLKNYGIPNFLRNVNTIRNNCNVDNYTNFVISQGSYWYLSMNNGCTARVVSSSNMKLENVVTPKWSCYLDTFGISNASNGSDYITSFTVNVDDSCGLVDNVNTNDRGVFNLYSSKKIPIFTPSNNGVINVYNNGVAYSVNRLPFGYTYPKDVTLGYLSNYDKSLVGLEGYFGPYIYSSGDSTVIDSTQSQFSYHYITGVYNGGLRFDYSTGRVSVAATNLYENQTYHLYLNYKLSSEDWVVDFAYSDYYAYLYTSSPGSGDLINPTFPNDIDIGLINTINSMNEYTPETDSYINSLFPYFFSGDSSLNFSGNLFSGELFSGDFFGSVSFNNKDDYGVRNFIYLIVNDFYKLLSNYDNVTINFGILGDINSGDFVIQNVELLSFISLFTTAFFIISFVLFYYRLFKTVFTVDITGLYKFDFDNLFKMF